MTAGIFADCVFFLKLNNLSFKEKKDLKRSISSHGGSFSFVLNNKCTHVIASNASSLGSTHLKKIHKHHISLVNLEFIWKCIEEKQLLEEASDFEKPVDVILEKVKSVERKEASRFEFQLPKHKLCCIYCVTLCFSSLQKAYSFYLAKDSEKACERYAWRINDLKNKGFLQKDDAPSQAIPFASDALQKVLLEETINTGTISREVGYFVESIWTDAQGHLSNILSCPVNNISINDVGVAEGILLQMKTSLAAQESASQMWVMMCEFYRLIPHISVSTQEITMELLTKKQELCQLIRDMLNVCETTPSTRYPSSLAKYRALRCRIELLDKNAEEFVRLSKQIVQKNYSNEPIEILNIYQIGRLSETCDFNGNLENVQPLLHATSPRNFVGILSRGLLMPKIITEEMGYNRTDVGNLGSGIYFTDSISTSVKYSEPSSTSGSRLLVVCDVALGKSREVYKKDYTITEPPGGFHSVHGVRRAHGIESDFEDDEFVVYKRNQIKMAYAVQFRTSRDIVVNLQPNVLSVELEETPEDSVEGLKPLEGGLQNTQGEQIPLEKIYVKAKVTDLVAQVILFQTYKNSSANPIEAKYVFPLDSTAAVCGFEAFINGKHVVGEVKEKQQARQEYRRAIKEGHGAYLMDQDTPDAFTVSVGNLPPKATVVIKITYLMELELDFGDACNFKIPGAVASWQKDTAIKENTQSRFTFTLLMTYCHSLLYFRIFSYINLFCRCFSLQMSIELPYKIDRIQCHTHKILTKKTDCKAVIQTMEGSSLSDAGFQLLIAMENPYVPRMWVERHPEKDSEACMLVFQPEFPNTCEAGDVTICLDCSNSMKPCFQNAQLLALYLASSVFSRGERNVVLFGSKELEKFIKPNMGGTEFWKPLHSLGLLPRNTGLHNIILISDGHLQNERHIIQFLKKNVGKIRLFTCGVGATANRHSLRRLALLGNGTFDFFDAKTKSKWKDQMQSLYIKLSNNRCTGVTLKWTRHNQPDEEPSQAPAKLPPIFSHGRLIVYGFIRHCTQATLKGLIEDKEMETMVSTTELQKTTGTMLHKLTARALIRDYEDGILHEEEDENEMQKQLRKSEIINLSKEYSIVTQFTSFIAVEKRVRSNLRCCSCIAPESFLEGFWMLTPELGKILEINVPFLTEVFLMKKGIVSLGKGKADVCGLIATLLVLQAIRLHNLLHSINFKSLLKLDESSGTSEYYQNIENAIKWARKVEQQYPGVCVRLGLGKDWDFVTKQLLRFEPLETSSELQPALEII
uniref:Poly [ADP-ribose] polymerase n=1 Tax=Leptobrachium leishanense TaxID=445787 RepID=A0A8C5M043_9ANUR